jgi:hypothetical protein
VKGLRAGGRNGLSNVCIYEQIKKFKKRKFLEHSQYDGFSVLIRFGAIIFTMLQKLEKTRLFAKKSFHPRDFCNSLLIVINSLTSFQQFFQR